MREDIIEIESLTKTYPNGFTALKNASFKIGRGEVVGYLGPNGAGKTTTIKILTNMIRPSSGKARVAGIDVTTDPKEAMKHIGALIEVPGTYGYMTPRRILRYFGRVHGLSGQQIEERTETVLDRVSLLKWKDSRLEGFSTGMQRRFAIAKAMLHDPEILILDEPVLGLDPNGIKDIRNMIRNLSNDGMTVFLSSHLLKEVSETCSRAVIINKGGIICDRDVSDILDPDSCPLIDIELLIPPSRKQIKSIVEMDEIGRIITDGGKVTIECSRPGDQTHKLLKELIGLDLKIRSFTPRQIDLEEYYMNLVNGSKGVA